MAEDGLKNQLMDAIPLIVQELSKQAGHEMVFTGNAAQQITMVMVMLETKDPWVYPEWIQEWHRRAFEWMLANTTGFDLT